MYANSGWTWTLFKSELYSHHVCVCFRQERELQKNIGGPSVRGRPALSDILRPVWLGAQCVEWSGARADARQRNKRQGADCSAQNRGWTEDSW